MMKLNKTISTIVLAAFLLNTVASDLAFGEPNIRPNTDNLAPGSLFSNLRGTQPKDMATIRLALETQLMSIVGKEVKSLSADGLKNIIENAARYKNTIFNPPGMQFFIHELTTNGSHCAIRCRFTDKNTKKPRTYYAVFPLTRDSENAFPVEVYTELEYQKFMDLFQRFDTFTQAAPQREAVKPEAAKAISRYIEQNERAIDRAIRNIIARGEFAEFKGRAEALGWNKKYPGRKRPRAYWSNELLELMRGRLDPALNKLGINVDKAFGDRNIVFLRAAGESSYPVIYENGHKIVVYSHTGAEAVYFFIRGETFDYITRDNIANLSSYKELERVSPEERNHVMAIESLLKDVVHEIGVIYGLSYKVAGSEIYNELREAFYALAFGRYKTGEEAFKLHPELRKLKKPAADLDRNLKTRDYATGRASSSGSAEPFRAIFEMNVTKEMTLSAIAKHPVAKKLVSIIVQAFKDENSGKGMDAKGVQRVKDSFLGALKAAGPGDLIRAGAVLEGIFGRLTGPKGSIADGLIGMLNMAASRADYTKTQLEPSSPDEKRFHAVFESVVRTKYRNLIAQRRPITAALVDITIDAFLSENSPQGVDREMVIKDFTETLTNVTVTFDDVTRAAITLQDILGAKGVLKSDSIVSELIKILNEAVTGKPVSRGARKSASGHAMPAEDIFDGLVRFFSINADELLKGKSIDTLRLPETQKDKVFSLSFTTKLQPGVVRAPIKYNYEIRLTEGAIEFKSVFLRTGYSAKSDEPVITSTIKFGAGAAAVEDNSGAAPIKYKYACDPSINPLLYLAWDATHRRICAVVTDEFFNDYDRELARMQAEGTAIKGSHSMPVFLPIEKIIPLRDARERSDLKIMRPTSNINISTVSRSSASGMREEIAQAISSRLNIESLIKNLNGNDILTHNHAAILLSFVNTPSSLNAMIMRIAKEDDWVVLNVLRDSVAYLRSQGIEPDMALPDQKTLIRNLSSNDWRTSFRAAVLLGFIKNRLSLKAMTKHASKERSLPILDALKDSIAYLRSQGIEPDRILFSQKALIRDLGIDDRHIQFRAALLLSFIKTPSTLNAMIDRIADERYTMVLRQLSDSIAYLRNQGVKPDMALIDKEALISDLGINDWHRRNRAAVLLGFIEEPSSLDAMIERTAVSEDIDVLRSLRDSIAYLRNKGVKPAKTLLNQETLIRNTIANLGGYDAHIRFRAALLLSFVNTPSSLNAMIACLPGERYIDVLHTLRDSIDYLARSLEEAAPTAPAVVESEPRRSASGLPAIKVLVITDNKTISGWVVNNLAGKAYRKDAVGDAYRYDVISAETPDAALKILAANPNISLMITTGFDKPAAGPAASLPPITVPVIQIEDGRQVPGWLTRNIKATLVPTHLHSALIPSVEKALAETEPRRSASGLQALKVYVNNIAERENITDITRVRLHRRIEDGKLIRTLEIVGKKQKGGNITKGAYAFRGDNVNELVEYFSGVLNDKSLWRLSFNVETFKQPYIDSVESLLGELPAKLESLKWESGVSHEFGNVTAEGVVWDGAGKVRGILVDVPSVFDAGRASASGKEESLLRQARAFFAKGERYVKKERYSDAIVAFLDSSRIYRRLWGTDYAAFLRANDTINIIVQTGTFEECVRASRINFAHLKPRDDSDDLSRAIYARLADRIKQIGSLDKIEIVNGKPVLERGNLIVDEKGRIFWVRDIDETYIMISPLEFSNMDLKQIMPIMNFAGQFSNASILRSVPIRAKENIGDEEAKRLAEELRKRAEGPGIVDAGKTAALVRPASRAAAVPTKDSKGSVSQSAASPLDDSRKSASGLPEIKVLVISDNRERLKWMSDFLRGGEYRAEGDSGDVYEYKVIKAETPTEALNILAANSDIELIITFGFNNPDVESAASLPRITAPVIHIYDGNVYYEKEVPEYLRPNMSLILDFHSPIYFNPMEAVEKVLTEVAPDVRRRLAEKNYGSLCNEIVTLLWEDHYRRVKKERGDWYRWEDARSRSERERIEGRHSKRLENICKAIANASVEEREAFVTSYDFKALSGPTRKYLADHYDLRSPKTGDQPQSGRKGGEAPVSRKVLESAGTVGVQPLETVQREQFPVVCRQIKEGKFNVVVIHKGAIDKDRYGKVVNIYGDNGFSAEWGSEVLQIWFDDISYLGSTAPVTSQARASASGMRTARARVSFNEENAFIGPLSGDRCFYARLEDLSDRDKALLDTELNSRLPHGSYALIGRYNAGGPEALIKATRITKQDISRLDVDTQALLRRQLEAAYQTGIEVRTRSKGLLNIGSVSDGGLMVVEFLLFDGDDTILDELVAIQGEIIQFIPIATKVSVGLKAKALPNYAHDLTINFTDIVEDTFADASSRNSASGLETAETDWIHELRPMSVEDMGRLVATNIRAYSGVTEAARLSQKQLRRIALALTSEDSAMREAAIGVKNAIIGETALKATSVTTGKESNEIRERINTYRGYREVLEGLVRLIESSREAGQGANLRRSASGQNFERSFSHYTAAIGTYQFMEPPELIKVLREACASQPQNLKPRSIENADAIIAAYEEKQRLSQKEIAIARRILLDYTSNVFNERIYISTSLPEVSRLLENAGELLRSNSLQGPARKTLVGIIRYADREKALTAELVALLERIIARSKTPRQASSEKPRQSASGESLDISAYAGLPVTLNMATGEIALGKEIISEPKWERPLSDAGNSIAEPEIIKSEPGRIIYHGYRNARLTGDTEAVDRLKLRFDITVLQPGLVGQEFIMTKGHIHPAVNGSTFNHPEFYEVWNGYALYVQQGTNPDTGKFELIATFVKPGDKVLLIPGYSHRTVNVGAAPLVMANWISDEVGGKEGKEVSRIKPDFSEIEAKNGYAYHIVRSAEGKIEFRHNPKYGRQAADIRFAIPAVSIPELALSGQVPMYSLVRNEKLADALSVFLRSPEGLERLYKTAFEFLDRDEFNALVSAATESDADVGRESVPRPEGLGTESEQQARDSASGMEDRPGYVGTIVQIPEAGTDRIGVEGARTVRLFEIFEIGLTPEEEAHVIAEIRNNPTKHVLLLKENVLQEANAGPVKGRTLTPEDGIIPEGFIGKEVTIGDNCPAMLEGAPSQDLRVLPAEATHVRISPASLCRIKVHDEEGNIYYLVSLNKNRIKKGKLVITPIGGAYDFQGPASKAEYDIPMTPDDANKPLEMRQTIPVTYLRRFMELFEQGAGREKTPLRELMEELVGNMSEEDVFRNTPEMVPVMRYSFALYDQAEELFGAILRALPKEADEQKEGARNAALRKAFEIALRYHEGVLRNDGRAYISHPLEIAYAAVVGLGVSDQTAILAALLHDIPEDARVQALGLQEADKVTAPRIHDFLVREGLVGNDVGVEADTLAQVLEDMTERSELREREGRLAVKLEHLERAAAGNNPISILLKALDRAHNLLTKSPAANASRPMEAEEVNRWQGLLEHSAIPPAVKRELGGLLAAAPIQGPSAPSRPSASGAQDEVDKEIAAMIALAGSEEIVRQIPTHPAERYTLVVARSLFQKDSEVDRDIAGYVLPDGRHVGAGDRFGLISADTSNAKNILANIEGLDFNRVIVQVSKELTNAELQELLKNAPGIRVVRVDTTFEKINGKLSDDARREYRFDLYAYMLAARKLDDKDIAERSNIYRIVEFFIKTHLSEELGDAEAAAVATDYISALAKNDIARLVKISLSYRPIKRWDVPSYHSIAVVLISA